MRTCEIEGCDRVHEARGLCNTHYARSRRGIPLDVPIVPHIRANLERRFWRFVTVIPGECWGWTGSTQGGYGQVGAVGRPVRAHRLSWELHRGPVPDGMFVCHTCDNRRCCNPDHLFIGTQMDNMRDMWAKGRGAVGESHGRHTLTEAQVLAIRADDRSQRLIAEDYGISQTAVSAIKRRAIWAWLQDAS